MIRKSKVAIPGIDLAFRPRSYFWPMGLETHLLTRVKGAERKATVQGLIDAGRVDDVFEFIAKPSLDEDERTAVGRIHPRFMGGEYLPDLVENEVEIARITLASTLQDVTSVYARRGRRRIHYRVVDEYSGETLTGRTARTSTRPLALGELETFFNSAFGLFDILEMNFGDDGYPPDEVLTFVRATSPFYPQIGELYAWRVAEWLADRRADCDSEDDDEPAAVDQVAMMGEAPK